MPWSDTDYQSLNEIPLVLLLWVNIVAFCKWRNLVNINNFYSYCVGDIIIKSTVQRPVYLYFQLSSVCNIAEFVVRILPFFAVI